MPAHPHKTALRHFLTVYQERKVFGMFRISPLTVSYDIATENTSFAVFILHLTFHTNTSSPFCLPTCIGRLQAAPWKVQKGIFSFHWLKRQYSFFSHCFFQVEASGLLS